MRSFKRGGAVCITALLALALSGCAKDAPDEASTDADMVSEDASGQDDAPKLTDAVAQVDTVASVDTAAPVDTTAQIDATTPVDAGACVGDVS